MLEVRVGIRIKISAEIIIVMGGPFIIMMLAVIMIIMDGGIFMSCLIHQCLHGSQNMEDNINSLDLHVVPGLDYFLWPRHVERHFAAEYASRHLGCRVTVKIHLSTLRVIAEYA